MTNKQQMRPMDIIGEMYCKYIIWNIQLVTDPFRFFNCRMKSLKWRKTPHKSHQHECDAMNQTKTIIKMCKILCAAICIYYKVICHLWLFLLCFCWHFFLSSHSNSGNNEAKNQNHHHHCKPQMIRCRRKKKEKKQPKEKVS